MQVPNVGAFVRALLPVHLTEGDSLTFGLWVSIDARGNRLRSIFDLWWDDTRYAEFRLKGVLANKLPLWGLLAAPVEADVRDVRETPYCSSSPNAQLADVITRTWDRDTVLGSVGLA